MTGCTQSESGSLRPDQDDPPVSVAQLQAQLELERAHHKRVVAGLRAAHSLRLPTADALRREAEVTQEAWVRRANAALAATQAAVAAAAPASYRLVVDLQRWKAKHDHLQQQLADQEHRTLLQIEAAKTATAAAVVAVYAPLVQTIETKEEADGKRPSQLSLRRDTVCVGFWQWVWGQFWS